MVPIAAAGADAAQVFLDRLHASGVFQDSRTLDEIKQGWVESATELASEFTQAEAVIAQPKELLRLARTKTTTGSTPAVQGFYVDCLKAFGGDAGNDLALTIVERNGWRLPTAYISKSFYARAREKAESWAPLVPSTFP